MTGTQRLPWHHVIGLRNRLVHAYFDINLGIVWDIVQVDLPRLKRELSALVS